MIRKSFALQSLLALTMTGTLLVACGGSSESEGNGGGGDAGNAGAAGHALPDDAGAGQGGTTQDAGLPDHAAPDAADASGGNDASDSGDAAPADAADPCSPNPCNAKAPTCDGTELITFVQQGTCAVENGQAACTYPELTRYDCAAENHGTCTTGGTCQPGQYAPTGKASFFSRMVLGQTGGTPNTGFDQNGDGQIDNALGKLVKSMESFVGSDPSALPPMKYINDGHFAPVVEYQDLDDATNDSALTMWAFRGLYATPPADVTAAKAGNGIFKANPADYRTGTQVSQFLFPTVSIAAGKLTTKAPGVFPFVFPVLPFEKPGWVPIRNARIEADVHMSSDSKGLVFTDGVLGGWMLMKDLWKGFNDSIDANCSCLGLTAPLVQIDQQTGKYKCVKTGDSSNCTAEGQDSDCKTSYDFCSTMIPLVKPDLDTDGDSTKDAMSVGCWVDGVQTVVQAPVH